MFIVLSINSSTTLNEISGRKCFSLKAVSFQVIICDWSLTCVSFSAWAPKRPELPSPLTYSSSLYNPSFQFRWRLIHHAELMVLLAFLQIHLGSSWVKDRSYISRISPICFHLRILNACLTWLQGLWESARAHFTHLTCERKRWEEPEEKPMVSARGAQL